MAASSRLFLSCNRQLSRSLIGEPPVDFQAIYSLHRNPPRCSCGGVPLASLVFHTHSSSPNFLSVPSFESLGPSPFQISIGNFKRAFFGTDNCSFQWNFASGKTLINDHGGKIFPLDSGPEIAVVILGWLGGRRKHLRRYIELYNAKGIHAISFVASVTDVLSFDLGKKLERRIQTLADEISLWLSTENGRERFIIFHTFSNTGWLVYGYLLHYLKDKKQQLLDRIKGCVVDSGGDPNINPKVWAAGFTAALLKKSSLSAYPTAEAEAVSTIESLMLASFEKLFAHLLNIPSINQRLSKVVSVLSDHQPPCPQLYLYSTEDRVIPFEAVESFMEVQRARGKRVSSFNFGTSPHVDHFRSFPDAYALRVRDFLEENVFS